MAENARRATGIEQLVDKYRMLVELRRAAPGRSDERRDAMRAIAARFPGALREWDVVSAQELERRLALAEQVCAANDADPARGNALLSQAGAEALRYGLAVHERLREALVIKRWLGGNPTRERLVEAARRFALPIDAIERIAAPPGGRISELVYDDASRDLGVAIEALKATLFSLDPPGALPGAKP